MKKDTKSFWKSWRSKFSNKKVSSVIDGICQPVNIAERFADIFKAACTPNSNKRHAALNKRLCYCRGTARRATSVEILWPFFD